MLKFKVLLIIITYTILFSCINQTNSISHKAKKPDFYGKIKETRLYVNCDYEITNINHSNLIKADAQLAVINKYSESGILIELLAYNCGPTVVSQSQLATHNVFTLDQNNNIIVEKLRSYFRNTVFSDFKYVYTYDKNNNLVEKVKFIKEIFKSRIEYYYQDTLLVEEKHFNSENKLEEHTVYEYDRKSRLIYESTIDGFGNNKYHSIYEYDLKGDLKLEKYFEEGKLVDVYQEGDNPNIIRDEMGNIIENNFSDGSKKYMYEYDKFGNEIMQSYYNYNKWLFTKRWYYNENNILIKQEHSYSSGTEPYIKITSFITNDSFGNEIKRKNVVSSGQIHWEYTIIDYWE